MNTSDAKKLFDPELYQYIPDDIEDIKVVSIDIAFDIINTAIANNQYSEKTISKLQDSIRAIKLANCYFYHVNALLSNKHTEESFRTELIKDLQQI
jgi:hypothetical protein